MTFWHTIIFIIITVVTVIVYMHSLYIQYIVLLVAAQLIIKLDIHMV